MLIATMGLRILDVKFGEVKSWNGWERSGDGETTNEATDKWLIAT